MRRPSALLSVTGFCPPAAHGTSATLGSTLVEFFLSGLRALRFLRVARTHGSREHRTNRKCETTFHVTYSAVADFGSGGDGMW